ncbi:hypothetical protein CTAYLR_006599, partial [Chrysophaeum taylorii]
MKRYCFLLVFGSAAGYQGVAGTLRSARDAVLRDVAAVEQATDVQRVARDAAGVSSVLGWLRAQPSTARRRIQGGIASVDDIVELRRSSGGVELSTTISSGDGFHDAKRRALDALARCVCSEAPPPSRLPRVADDAAAWDLEGAALEDLGWALAAAAEEGEGLEAQDASRNDDGSFVCSFSCGTELRLGARGLLSVSSPNPDARAAIENIVAELCAVPVVERQPTAGAAWATAVIDELVRCGVDRFVACPGSRSTPLALAARRHPRASKKLVITTSGTAALNLLPAAAEATEDGVPLVLLTADRPAEVRGVGADQALSSQRSLLDGLGPTAAKWSRDLGPADERVNYRVAMLGELAEISRGVLAAKSRRMPAHFNMAFRENLAPRRGGRLGFSLRSFSRRSRSRVVAGARGFGHARADHPARVGEWDRACVRGAKFLKWDRGCKPLVSEGALGEQTGAEDALLWETIDRAAFGVVLVGRIVESAAERAAAIWLVTEVLRDWTVVHCDPQSGIRAEIGCVQRPGVVFAEPLVARAVAPDVVLQIGASFVLPPAVRAWLDAAFDAGAEKIIAATALDGHETRVDDDGAATFRFRGSVTAFAETLSARRRRRRRRQGTTSSLTTGVLSRAAEAAVRSAVLDSPELTEPAVARLTTAACAARGGRLFASNSMPIRDVDAYGVPIAAAANRGLAGIDGILATAAGYASAGSGATPVFLLVGDQALLHDLSSLRILADQKERGRIFKVILVNNNGGAIFSFLPVSDLDADDALDEETEFEPLFGAPHRADFQALAAGFGLLGGFARCSTRAALESALADDRSVVIEAKVATTRRENVRTHRKIDARARAAVRAALVGDATRVGAVSLAWSRVRPPPPPPPGFDFFPPSERKKKNKPLVVLHGLFGTNSDLDRVVRLGDLCDDDREVIKFDLTGHGASGPAKIETFDVLGYSFGARLALGIKRAAPRRVRKVIAASANLEGRDSMSPTARRDRLETDRLT